MGTTKKDERLALAEQAVAGFDERAVAELAHQVDCFTEVELRALGGKLTHLTVEAWRKRGEGPPALRFGNSYFYPRSGVRFFFKRLAREHDDPRPAGA